MVLKDRNKTIWDCLSSFYARDTTAHALKLAGNGATTVLPGILHL
ncbi:hypothetical protein PPRY_a1246 [Pseudoalteromonas prydzensis ACAM 620]|nr:hypothetical protein [Pseudoalteromonas prydzensis ACAM 620]